MIEVESVTIQQFSDRDELTVKTSDGIYNAMPIPKQGYRVGQLITDLQTFARQIHAGLQDDTPLGDIDAQMCQAHASLNPPKLL